MKINKENPLIFLHCHWTSDVSTKVQWKQIMRKRKFVKILQKGMRTLSTMTCWNDFSPYVSFYVCDAIRGWNINRKSSGRKRLAALYVSFLGWDFFCMLLQSTIKPKAMNGKMMNWAYYDIFARDYRSSVVECDEIFRLLFFVVVRLKGKDYIEDGEKNPYYSSKIFKTTTCSSKCLRFIFSLLTKQYLFFRLIWNLIFQGLLCVKIEEHQKHLQPLE